MIKKCLETSVTCFLNLKRLLLPLDTRTQGNISKENNQGRSEPDPSHKAASDTNMYNLHVYIHRRPES